MKNVLLPLGLLGVGILLIAGKKKTIKEDLERKNLIAFFESLNLSKIDFNKIVESIQNMSDEDIEFLTNVFVKELFVFPLSGKALTYLGNLFYKYQINFDYETYNNA